jgi:hypothetical protein
MISIKDRLLLRVAEDFDTMLNKALEKMTQDKIKEGEVTLKLKIDIRRSSLKEGGKEVNTVEPGFSHKVKSKLISSGQFEGAVLEALCLIGNSEENFELVEKKDAQISMFEKEEGIKA